MSGSNRLAAIALGLTLLAPPALAQEAHQPALESQPEAKAGQQPGASQGDHTAQQQPSQAEKLLPALQAIEGAIRDAVPKEDAAERQRQEQRDIDDLSAQKEMALWAKLMFWTSVGTVILTFGGLLLIWRTLIHTRDAAKHAGAAVREAEKATKAAEDTVAVTRELGEAQIRAYLSIRKAWFVDKEDAFPKVIIQVRNSGQSTAYNLKVVFRACSGTFSSGANADATVTDGSLAEFQLADLWPSGADEELSFGINPKNLVDTLGRKTPDARCAMVELILEYQTVFDRSSGRIDMDTAVRLLIPRVPNVGHPENRQVNATRRPVAVMTNFTAGWITDYRRILSNGRVIKRVAAEEA